MLHADLCAHFGGLHKLSVLLFSAFKTPGMVHFGLTGLIFLAVCGLQLHAEQAADSSA